MELVFANLIIGLVMGFVVMTIAESKGYEQSFGWFFLRTNDLASSILIHLLYHIGKKRREFYAATGNRKVMDKKPIQEKESRIIILPKSDFVVGRNERVELERKQKAEIEAKLEQDKSLKIRQIERESKALFAFGFLVIIVMFGIFAFY